MTDHQLERMRGVHTQPTESGCATAFTVKHLNQVSQSNWGGETQELSAFIGKTVYWSADSAGAATRQGADVPAGKEIRAGILSISTAQCQNRSLATARRVLRSLAPLQASKLDSLTVNSQHDQYASAR